MGNNSESLLNEIRQIFYLLYQSKEITKKVYNNILDPSNYKMDTIFMNLENSKTSEQHILILKLTNKLDLRIGEKIITLSNLSIYYTWKNIKNHTITINLIYLHQHVMINLNYLMDDILYQIFKIILSIFKKSMEKILINHQDRYM